MKSTSQNTAARMSRHSLYCDRLRRSKRLVDHSRQFEFNVDPAVRSRKCLSFEKE
jgi:hypothetical protein